MLETHQLWETIDVRKRSFIDNVNPLRLFQYYCFDALTCNQYLCYTFCMTLLLFNSNMNSIHYTEEVIHRSCYYSVLYDLLYSLYSWATIWRGHLLVMLLSIPKMQLGSKVLPPLDVALFIHPMIIFNNIVINGRCYP